MAKLSIENRLYRRQLDLDKAAEIEHRKARLAKYLNDGDLLVKIDTGKGRNVFPAHHVLAVMQQKKLHAVITGEMDDKTKHLLPPGVSGHDRESVATVGRVKSQDFHGHEKALLALRLKDDDLRRGFTHYLQRWSDRPTLISMDAVHEAHRLSRQYETMGRFPEKYHATFYEQVDGSGLSGLGQVLNCLAHDRVVGDYAKGFVTCNEFLVICIQAAAIAALLNLELLRRDLREAHGVAAENIGRYINRAVVMNRAIELFANKGDAERNLLLGIMDARIDVVFREVLKETLPRTFQGQAKLCYPDLMFKSARLDPKIIETGYYEKSRFTRYEPVARTHMRRVRG